MPRVTVRKYTHQGQYVTSWVGEVVRRTAEHVLLRATWTRPSTAVADLVFEPGDIFLEYYYPKQPYSVWEVRGGATDTLKGWYCNVGLPLDTGGDVFEVRDLLLDVLVYPDGRYTVLDEDEFAVARASGLSPELVAVAQDAVGAIISLVERREAPFGMIAHGIHVAGSA